MDASLTILTFLAIALGIYYALKKRSNVLAELGIIHEKPLPFFGNNLSSIFRRCHVTESVGRLYRMNEDAKYVGFYDFDEPIIVIRSPELIKSIAIKNFDHFTDHRFFADPEQDSLLAENLIGLRGERWKRVRNLLSPAFTSSKMRTMFELITDCGQKFADFLADRSTLGPKVVDTKDAFSRYTTDVIATCAFGISVDSMREPTNPFHRHGKSMINLDGLRIVKFFFSRMFPRVAKLLNLKFISSESETFFVNTVKETIERRDREGIGRTDMIQLMMETRGKIVNEYPELTINEMTAQAFIFFFGGFESVSTAMCFVAYEIAANPIVRDKLRDEVDKVVRETNGVPNYESLNGMQYLDAVVSESLRLYPVAAFLDRICVKTFELPPALPGGKPITIQPGQAIWFPAYCIHRDEKYFPDPDKFDPDRFLDSEKNRIDPFTYFPFGNGPRMCIASRFALLEIKVSIFYLLAKCQLETSPKTVVPLELDRASFAMVPKGGFWLQLRSRKT